MSLPAILERGKAMTSQTIIGGVALIFSITCFIFFCVDAFRRLNPAPAMNRAEANARASLDEGRESLDVAALAAFVKAIAEAFAKAGPGALALIGSILFLLLAGEATDVWNITGTEAADGAGQYEADAGGAADPGDASNMATDSNQPGADDGATNSGTVS
jgi:hypothetical protein